MLPGSLMLFSCRRHECLETRVTRLAYFMPVFKISIPPLAKIGWWALPGPRNDSETLRSRHARCKSRPESIITNSTPVFFFFFSEFVFRVHVTTDKEAVTLKCVVCMTSWNDACPLGWCVCMNVGGWGNEHCTHRSRY